MSISLIVQWNVPFIGLAAQIFLSTEKLCTLYSVTQNINHVLLLTNTTVKKVNNYTKIIDFSISFIVLV